MNQSNRYIFDLKLHTYKILIPSSKARVREVLGLGFTVLSPFAFLLQEAEVTMLRLRTLSDGMGNMRTIKLARNFFHQSC